MLSTCPFATTERVTVIMNLLYVECSLIAYLRQEQYYGLARFKIDTEGLNTRAL